MYFMVFKNKSKKHRKICFTRLNSKLNTPTHKQPPNEAEERNSFFIEPFNARGEASYIYTLLVGLFFFGGGCCCV